MKFTAGSMRGGQEYSNPSSANLAAKVLAMSYNCITDNGTWYPIVVYSSRRRCWIASTEFWENVVEAPAVETPVQNSLVLV